MNIFNKSSLISYYTKNTQTKKALQLWYHDVLSKDWKMPTDVLKDFNTAKIIKNNRARFEILGKQFRIIIELNYQKGAVFIKFIGSHAEYDKVDAETVNLYPKKVKKKK